MAKGNLFLGKARGKVGDVVFSTLNGMQISRAYQPQVKNPRTTPQMVQRAIFATTSVASGILSDIVDHSFDGFKEGQDNRQEFVRSNISLMNSRYEEYGYDGLNAFILKKGQKYIKPFPYMVSRGSLGILEPREPRVLFLGNDSGVTKTELLQQFPFLKNGSQLTFLVMSYATSATGISFYRVRKCRLVFNDRFESYNGFFNNGNIAGIINHTWIDAGFLDVPKCEGVTLATETGAFPGDDDTTDFPVVRIDWAGPLTSQIAEGGSQADDRWFAQRNEVPIGICIIGTNYDSSLSDPWIHTTSYFSIDTDRWDDTEDNISSYGNAAKVQKQSDYYLDQATFDPNENVVDEDYTIDQVMTAEVAAIGLSSKQLNVTGSNSYGPVPENVMVTFFLYLPTGWRFDRSTAKIFNGENNLSNVAQITSVQQASQLVIRVPMPTTTSFNAQISCNVYNASGDPVGIAALRCNVSKVNA